MKQSAKHLAQQLFVATEGKSGKELEETTAAFVELLRSRHQSSRWREIVRAFDGVWREVYGAAYIRIASAHSLPAAVIHDLAKRFPGVRIEEEERPELIGGAHLEIDDWVLDGTLKTKLQTLRTTLTDNAL